MKSATVYISLSVLLITLIAPANATILYSEDFSSGNASRTVWDEYPNSSHFDASSGDYVLTQQDGQTPVYSYLTGVPEVSSLTDTSVRTQVRLEGTSVGSVALFSRYDGSTTYQGGFSDNEGVKALYIGYNDINAPFPGFTLLDGVLFDYDLNNQDLILQLDVVGDQLNLWAWQPGEGKPELPQLMYTDTAALAMSGVPGILHDPASPDSASTATFRYIQVANSPIPEPSTGILGTLLALSILALARCRRGRR